MLSEALAEEELEVEAINPQEEGKIKLFHKNLFKNSRSHLGHDGQRPALA